MAVNSFQANQGTQTNLLTDNTGGTLGTLIPVYKLSLDGQGTFTTGNIWNGGVIGTINAGTINAATISSLPNIPGGTLNAGTVQISGGTINVGTVQMSSGTLNVGTISTLPNLPQGSINVTAGTIGTVAGVGVVSVLTKGTISLGSVGGIDANAVAQTGLPIGIGGTDSGGTIRTIKVDSGGLQRVGLDSGTISVLPNLPQGSINVTAGTVSTGTINTGTINLGTITGKDANAVAQTGNPIGIGGTDSGGTIRTVNVDSTGAMKVSGASAGTFVNLSTGTLNAGTVTVNNGTASPVNIRILDPSGANVANAGNNAIRTVSTGGLIEDVSVVDVLSLGTVVGKDANAAAQTGNPISIGGTDSGGTVRTVLVNSAGAMSVSGASSGTFNNISTGTMQTLGTVGTVQNILAGTISGLQNGTITAGSIVVTAGTVVNNGGSAIAYGPAAAAAAAAGNPLNVGGTDSGGTIRTIKVDSGGLQRIGLDSGTISVLPNLPQGSINVTAGTMIMTTGTINTGTINAGSIIVTAGTVSAGTLNAGTINTGTINTGTINTGTFVMTSGTLNVGTAVMPSGTLNVGTINIGTMVGKDANAAAQTGNPVSIGGTDSGGTVRTVLVNSAGAMSVSGASSGTYVNLATGTLNAGTVTANQGAADWKMNLDQVGAAAIILGANTAANSIPVTVASDQDKIPTTQYGNGPFSTTWTSATADNAANSQNLTNYPSIFITYRPNGVVSTGTVNFETSDDNLNWYPINGVRTNSYTTESFYNLGSGTQSWFFSNAGALYVRARLHPQMTGAGSALINITGVSGVHFPNPSVGMISGTLNAGTINAGTISTGSIVQTAGTVNTGTINTGTFVMTVGTVSVLPNLPQGSINVTAGTISAGTVNTGTINAGTINVGTITAGTINTGTITAGSIVVTAGTVAAGTVHLAGTVLDNFTGLGTFTITLGTLASSGSVGRQSTLVDNTSNLWPAALIGCQITAGTATAAGQINVYLIRSDNGGGPIQDDLTGASDALATVNNMPLLGVIPTVVGTNTMYKAVYDTSFLGHLGPKFGIVVQHALGNPLAVAGSQSITYQSLMPKFT